MNNTNNTNTVNNTVNLISALMPCGALFFDPALLHEGEKAVIVRSAVDPRFAVLARNSLSPSIMVHDGPFHADEVLCVAMIDSYLGRTSYSEVERTRDVSGYARNALVIDVGEGLLDHHGKRAEKGVAACTRVFQLLLQTELEYNGSDNTKYQWMVKELWPVVQKVSAQDTGTAVDNHPFPWVVMLSEYARRSKRPDDMFEKAVDRAREELRWSYSNFRAREKAAAAVDDVILGHEEDEILVFDTECRDADTKRLMHNAGSKAKYYISPENEDDWRVLCACNPAEEFSYYSSWKLIPEKYRGLRGEELSAATGIDGGIFCHAAGFIAGFKTREAAVEFAKLCLRD